VRLVVQWYGCVSRVAGAGTIASEVEGLVAVLDGMDAAVVAVRTGDTQVITNAAARSLYALPEHRPVLVDDLACRVQIFHARRLQRLGVDELPLIQALAGSPVDAEVIVTSLDRDRLGEVRPPRPPSSGRRLRLRARPLIGSEGEIVGSVCTAQDVTDLHTERAQLTRRTAELAAINRVTRAILTDEDARRAVCEAALAVSGAVLASLYEPDGRGDLVCTTHVGADLLGARLPEGGESVVAEVFATGVPRVQQGVGPHLDMDQRALDRIATAPSSVGSPAASVPQPSSVTFPDLAVVGGPADRVERLRAAAWLPVTSREGLCIAVLSLAFGPEVTVGEHLPVLEILAGETAVAIERQDLLRRLRREAASDGLTGAANRRVWDEELPRALAQARRDGAPLSVVMLDLDHFKQYNDAFGHPAGDKLLRDAVAAWRRRLRAGDLLCRYGGEEFVILLPGCDVLEARSMAEQLRALVPDRQTCSAGVAVWNGHEAPEVLVDRLDAALYAAKVAGRDHVRVAH
jgi:diguanylate cyclase (GGDEF)-like protein